MLRDTAKYTTGNTFSVITITMPDGSRGQHMGFYAHVIDAVVRAMDYFPDARRISGRPA